MGYTRREVVAPSLTGGTTTVSIGSSHTESAAIQANVVRLVATVACYVAFGSAPTATSSSMYLAAGAAEYFGFNPGDKISVLQVTSGGTLSIAY